MDVKTFIEHLQESISSLENELTFPGPYADEFEIVDDGVIIPFDDGTRFRLHIQIV